MKTLLTTLLLTLTLAASGQVLIWKGTLTSTAIGARSTARQTFTAYAVYDDLGGDFADVIVDAKGKRFKIEFPPDLYSLLPVDGAGKEWTVFGQATFSADANGNDLVDTFTAKGINVSTDIGASRNFRVPKTLQYQGKGVRYTNSGAPRFEEVSGNLIFDLKSTKAHNGAGSTVDDVLEGLRTVLLSQGYVEY